MKLGLSFSQMTPYLKNKMILGIVISLLTLVMHCSVSSKEQLRAALCSLFFFGWIGSCVASPFDPIATLCMWHPLISFSFLSAPAPYQLDQNKNNTIAILKKSEECWREEGDIEKGNE